MSLGEAPEKKPKKKPCLLYTSNGGDYYWMRITARIVQRESDGSVHMLTYRQNIDAEKRWEQRMRELAQTDEMTGLYTKTATARHITELLASEPQANYALFMLCLLYTSRCV